MKIHHCMKMLCVLLALAGLRTTAAFAQEDKPLMAYIGTFSSPLKDTLPTQVDLRQAMVEASISSKSIARRGNSPKRARSTSAPAGCLAVNKSGTIMYSANETDRVGDKKEGSISSFAIDRANGQLMKLLNTVRSGGAGPTYISIHPGGKHLLVANYFGGSVSVLPILADGKLGEPTDVKDDAGKIGPTKAVNAPPGSFAFSGHDRTHAHMIEADAAGKFVFHADLGLDLIYIWKFDAASGKLAPAATPSVALPPGDGPRHFHFHPNGKWFYSIQGGRLDDRAVRLRCQHWSSQRAANHFHPSTRLRRQQFLFGDSGLCRWKVCVRRQSLARHDRYLRHRQRWPAELRGEEWTRGNYPRSFAFDPTGKFLYCCNQRADNVAVLEVNKSTGGLKFTGQYVPVGNPSHVAFVDLK